jgi:hypothetical protein
LRAALSARSFARPPVMISGKADDPITRRTEQRTLDGLRLGRLHARSQPRTLARTNRASPSRPPPLSRRNAGGGERRVVARSIAGSGRRDGFEAWGGVAKEAKQRQDGIFVRCNISIAMHLLSLVPCAPRKSRSATI